MNIFVTGLAGYLGRALAQLALEQGHSIRGIGRSPLQEPLPDGVEFHQLDVSSTDEMRRLLSGCDALIHTAAMHLENANEAGCALPDYIRANVEGTARLGETAIEAGVRRLILCSSMTVQVGRDFTASGAAVLSEDMPATGIHPYPISKFLMEKLGEQIARKHGVSVASIRHMAFGHGNKSAGSNLIAWFLTARDAARACLCAAERDGLRGEAFNIGSGTPMTNAEIAESQDDPAAFMEKKWPGALAILERTGWEVKRRDFWPICDNSRARTLIGYEPQDTFENWLRENGWKG